MSASKSNDPALTAFIVFFIFLGGLIIFSAYNAHTDNVLTVNAITADGVYVTVTLDMPDEYTASQEEVISKIIRKIHKTTVLSNNIETDVQILSADMVSLNVRIRFLERISDVELAKVNDIVHIASVTFMSTDRDVMAHQIASKLEQLNIQATNISIVDITK